ncbi:MAG: glycosyltransferase family 39 protein [Candidatus Aminicenantes bacterium]|nr:glycosyltransferase family 39 protein [Candidatus Aminicenantes bacterium]
MSGSGRSAKVLKAILAGAGVLYVAAYLLTALARIAYPYELEAMEGGMVDHVLQLLGGGTLYGPPSLGFVPYAYPPLYFYLAAALTRLLGAGFLPLRLISLAASLGVMVLVYSFVRRETRQRSWAFVAAALFAATYRLSDAWLDLARIDSLYLLLILLFAFLVRFHSGRGGFTAPALVLLLAFLTKQSAPMIALPLLAYAVFFEKRRGAWLLGLSAALTAGAVWIMNLVHHGWYTYYIFDLTGQRWAQKVVPRRIAGFWTDDMLKPLGVALFLFLAFLLFEWGSEGKKRFFFYAAFAAGMIGSAWFSRLEYGAYGNALLSAHAMLAIGFGLGISRFWGAAAAPAFRTFLFAAALVQLALLAYNPLPLVPDAADRRAGDHLVRTLKALPGDVMVPGHGFLTHMAGKRRFAHEVALKNLTRIDRGPVGAALEREVEQAIAGRRFAALVLDTPNWFRPVLERGYEFRRAVFPDRAHFWPVSGTRRRPNLIYLPKKSPKFP